MFKQTLRVLAKRHKFSLETPWAKLPKKTRDVILFGYADDGFEGVIKVLDRRYRETVSEDARADVERFMALRDWSRLRAETLSVKIAGRSIADVVRFPIRSARQFFDTLTLTDRECPTST